MQRDGLKRKLPKRCGFGMKPCKIASTTIRISRSLSLKTAAHKALSTLSKTSELISHLETATYLKAEHIYSYIEQRFDVKFTVSGITTWLERNSFSYKKSRGTPAKVDPKKQTEFVRYYEDLLNTLPENDPVEFADAVHPTMVTKITCGWIRKGQDKLIATTASRTCVDLFGSINLGTMEVTIAAHETIDSKAMEKHFAALRKKHPKAPRIHQILDRGSYNTRAETKAAAEKYGIVLHHLPPIVPI